MRYYYLEMALPSSSSSNRPGGGVHPGNILQTTFSVAFLVATLFVGFSPTMFSGDFGSLISGLLTPQPDGSLALPTPQRAVRIGIVSGHWGNGDDSGAVCPDGTNERDVNLAVASLVRQKLEARGYEVDLLQEFDPRLEGYRAALLLSIHADTCQVIDAQATGFKVATSSYSADANLANRLAACLYDRYATATGLPHHKGSITVDMTDYHAFRATDPVTSAAILETGFLNLDRAVIVGRPDVVSDGVVAGILCFVNNESVQPTPASDP